MRLAAGDTEEGGQRTTRGDGYCFEAEGGKSPRVWYTLLGGRAVVTSVRESERVREKCGSRLELARQRVHDVLLERPDLEALEKHARCRFERVPVREILEGDDLSDGTSEDAELVDVDQRGERDGRRQRREFFEGRGVGERDERTGSIDFSGNVGLGRVEEGRKLGVEGEVAEEDA